MTATLTSEQRKMNEMIALALKQEKALEELSSSSSDEANATEDDSVSDLDEDRLPLHGNRTTMNLEKRLYSNICQSAYFKSLSDCPTFDDLWDEMSATVKHLGAWCGVSELHVGEGGPAYCILLRMHQLRITRHQLVRVIQASSAVLRCLGLLYVRYTQYRAPDLYGWVERHFQDTASVFLDQRLTESTTVGTFARDLLRKLRFLGTIFPRIPVDAANRLEQLLGEPIQDAAPLQPARKKRRREEASPPRSAPVVDSHSSDSDGPQPRFRAKFHNTNTMKPINSTRLLSLALEETQLSFKEQWALRAKQRASIAESKPHSPSPERAPTTQTLSSAAAPGQSAVKGRLEAIKKLYQAPLQDTAQDQHQQKLSKKALAKKDSLAPEVLRY